MGEGRSPDSATPVDVVAGVIRDKAGRILLARRTEGRDLAGLWEFPGGKREAFELFGQMLDKMKREVVTLLARVRIRTEEEIAQAEAADRARAEAIARQMQFKHPEMGGLGADEEAAAVAGTALELLPPGPSKRVGRNDPCPCGSGKKYKHCHGQLA